MTLEEVAQVLLDDMKHQRQMSRNMDFVKPLMPKDMADRIPTQWQESEDQGFAWIACEVDLETVDSAWIIPMGRALNYKTMLPFKLEEAQEAGYDVTLVRTEDDIMIALGYKDGTLHGVVKI